MAQRAHTDHCDPSCQPGENALSPKERFGAIFLTRAPAGRAGILQEGAAGILSLCLLPLQHRGAAQLVQELPAAPTTPLLADSRRGKCRLYSQHLMAGGKWNQERDGGHEKKEDRKPKSLLS